MSTFKHGAKTPPKMSRFTRVKYTRYFGDGTSETTLLSTRYAMTKSEKARAQRKADAINNRWNPEHPSYRKPKWANRHNTIIREEASVCTKSEQTGCAIPVYL